MKRRGLPPGLHFDARRRFYYLRFVDANGIRRNRAVGSDREIAIRVHAQAMRDRNRERFNLGDESKQERSIDEISVEYLEDLRSKVTPAHFRNVEHAIETVRAKVGARRVLDLRPAAVESAMADLRQRTRELKNGRSLTLSARTVNKMISHFQAMLRWAERTGRIARDPIRYVRKLDESKALAKRRHRLTMQEVDAIVAAAERYDAGGRYLRSNRIPQAPLFHTFRWTGLRWGEATKLRWSDLIVTRDASGSSTWLRVRKENSKVGVERTCPVPDGLATRLLALRATQGQVIRRIPQDEDRMFLTPLGCEWDEHNGGYGLKLLNRLIKDAGLPKRYPDGTSIDIHAIRHSFCTQLQIAEVDLATAADLMGHRDVNTTRRIYTDAAQVTKPKVKALGKLEDMARAERLLRKRRKDNA